MSSAAGFSPLRGVLWPIYGYELKKIIPMMLMIFFICFNYSILRNLKDSIVVTAESSGAEVIPFIKVWALLPSAVLVTFIFTKLSNKYSQERVFYIFISTFIAFFVTFAFLIYPLREALHPHAFADRVEAVLPLGLKGFVAMFRNWSFTIFYVFCELWSSMVMTVLFWGFANEITKLTEAKRFYGVFLCVANISSILSGFVANYLVYDSWEKTLDALILLVAIFGFIIMLIFRWMNKNVLNDASFDALHETRKESKTKEKLSIRDSFSYLSNSRYLVCIAILVLAYNLIINLVEIVWKDQLSQLYPDPQDYNIFMNYTTIVIGVISTTVSLLLSRFFVKFGWTSAALITPLMMLVTTVGFFSVILFPSSLAEPLTMLTGMSPLVIAVFFGLTQVVLSKGCKFSVFDATKEMAFIPLPHEVKLKGKAAIDGVGSRLGKSGGSLIHQGLLLVFGTLTASAPVVAGVIMVVISGWIVTVRSLGKKVSTLSNSPENPPAEETVSPKEPEGAVPVSS